MNCVSRRTMLCTFASILAMTAHLARAQVPAEVRGRVSDQSTGALVARAQVEVVGRAERAVTGVDGAFAIRGLDPRRYTIRVRAIGYALYDVDVEVVNGRAMALDVALQPVVASLAPIVVLSGRDTASSRVFDRRAIESSGRRDLGELLQTVPGVVVTQAGGPGSPSHVAIRGSGANEVLVVVDGTPVNSVITGEADLSRVNLDLVERVSVLPGAQSARYGGRALAGVVIVETRRGDGDVSASAALGAWGERDIGATIGRVVESSSLRAGVSLTADYRDIRGDFDYPVPDIRGGGSARRDNAGVRSGNVLATASLDGRGGALQLRGEWQSMSRGLAGSIVQPSVTGRERESRATAGLDGRWGSGLITWTADGDVSHEHATYADPLPPFGTPFDDAIDANAARLSVTSTAALALASASVGTEGRLLDVSSTALAPGAPGQQQLLGTWANLRASHSVGQSTDLAADLSARLDWDSLLRGETVSPRAGVTVSHAKASLSASVGNAFAPPSPADQFFHEGVLVRPNPDLRPERVRREVEVRAAVREVRAGAFDFDGEAAAYRADVSGMILWLPDFRFVWSPSNFDVRRSGWEASGGIAARSIGVDLHGSLSTADVTYTGSVLSGQVAYRPRVTGSVTAGATRGDARLEVTTRYVDSRRTVAGSALNVLEPYSLTNVKLAVPIVRSRWSIDATVGLDNVFDRPASMLVDYPFPGRTWTIALRTRRARQRAASHVAVSNP